MVDRLKTFTVLTIHVAPMPPRIEDLTNSDIMIEDRVTMLIWEGELCHLPSCRNDLRNGLVQIYALLWNNAHL